jgi:hypothetical protein
VAPLVRRAGLGALFYKHLHPPSQRSFHSHPLRGYGGGQTAAAGASRSNQHSRQRQKSKEGHSLRSNLWERNPGSEKTPRICLDVDIGGLGIELASISNQRSIDIGLKYQNHCFDDNYIAFWNLQE